MCKMARTDGTDGTDVLGFTRMRARARACVHALVYARTRTRARTARGYPPIYPSHPSPTQEPPVVSVASRGRIVFYMCPLSVPSVPEPLAVGGEQ
jgi:hypothetical protein